MCRKAVQAFGETYGWDRNIIIVRSTGRVNLLGMHIEHRGGSINPVAIKELFFLAESRDDDIVVMRNVDSDKFPDERFCIQDCLPDHKIKNWDVWCHDEFDKRKSNNPIYFYYMYLFLHQRHIQQEYNNREPLHHFL